MIFSHLRKADLVDGEVGIGRDDGAAGEVDPLAHHVHPEDARLSLNQLLEAPTDRVRRRRRGFHLL